MREIVTIQVGGFANFVGSHFWNFQDELLGLADDPNSDAVFKNHCLSMDALYRTGETQEGTLTYTPRLVSVGYQGSLGSLSSHGTLYNQTPEAPQQVVTWRGALSTQRSEPRKKNLFLQSLYEEELGQSSGNGQGHVDSQNDTREKEITDSLENSVQYWTDFSKVHYHPQSLYELSGLWTDAQEFNNYGIGKDVFSDSLRGEEISDRLRFFIEECDHMQGIQFLVDDSGGFSPIAADFLESVADEYTNTPVLLYVVREPNSFASIRSQKRMVSRDLHDAVSFSRLSSYCKLYVPVGLPFLSKSFSFLNVDDEKAYHSSAVYASAIHSLSLPFRMEMPGPAASSSCFCGASDMNGIIQMLSGEPRQNIVATLDAALPAPTLSGQQARQLLLSNFQTLSPEIEDTEDTLSVESLVIQGALLSGGERSERASISEVQDAINAAYQHSSRRPRFCHLSVSPCPLPIPLPFPSVFNGAIGKHGQVSAASAASGPPPKGPLDVESVPAAARLRSTSAASPFLSNRLENLRRFGTQRAAPGAELLRSWGFERDELEDMCESLSKMIMALDPYSQASSDSD